MATQDQAAPRIARNIVIFSDGTGQRGGLYFDEERTNVYKLYRATRVAPDSRIDPDAQMAFYDPGLGTLRDAGGRFEQFFRKIYKFVSQATGLGLTRNIIDCYAALIRLVATRRPNISLRVQPWRIHRALPCQCHLHVRNPDDWQGRQAACARH